MSATELLLYEVREDGHSLRLFGLGENSPDGVDFQIASLTVVAVTDGVGPLATHFEIHRDAALTFPLKLLRLDGNIYRLRSVDELEELGKEEWAALKARVRQRLAGPIDIVPGNGLFGVRGVGSAVLTGRICLNPALVDGYETLPAKGWVLRAQGSADINLDYRTGIAPVRFNGRFVASFIIAKETFQDWVIADFGFELPKLPGFSLKLPKVKLPELKFPDNIPFPELPPLPFALSLPPFLENVSFEWRTNPRLRIQLVDGVLSVSTVTPGEGAILFNGVGWVVLQDVSLAQADTTFAFQALVDVRGAPLVLDDAIIASDDIPFVVFLKDNTLVPALANLAIGNGELENASLSFTFSSSRIVICDHNEGIEKTKAKDQLVEQDFKVLLALQLAVTVDYDLSSGKVSTELNSVKILEPYPVELVKRAGRALGDLLRLVAAIPLPSAQVGGVDASGVLRLLERLGEMLATAAKWLARQAGAAAGFLAGLAEAVFEALGKLVRAIARLGETVISHLAIEVRLDPKTYKPRQILLMPVGDSAKLNGEMVLSALGFDFRLNAQIRPALMIDLGPDGWFGLVVQPTPGTKMALGTDLWLERDTGPQQSMGSTDKDGLSKGGRLIQLTAEPLAPNGGAPVHDIVVVALQHGRPKLFQTYSQAPGGEQFSDALAFGGNRVALAVREIGTLRDAGLRYEGTNYPDQADPVLELSLQTGELKDRLLSLLGKTGESDDTSGGNSFFDKLKQKVEILKTTWSFNGDERSITAAIDVKVHIEEEFAPTTTLTIAASARDLSMKITGGDKISIYSEKGKPEVNYHPLGLDLAVRPKKKIGPDEVYKQFYIDLSHGSESMGLADEAAARLSYGKVSTSGKGLQFDVPTFRVGRAGFDLEAKILPEPVTLGGVDVPFRFTSGGIAIKGSKFGGGSLAGSGQLPQQLVGEANASIALQLGAGADGGVVVKGATARLDKSGDPIRCSSTRFELTITELGFDFVDAGSYHFYFLLTGSAVFKPGGNEFASGLLKNFKDVTIKLDKAPIAADARALINAISFQVKVDPPKRMSFFDIFDFELRGFGFHPSAPKFGGDPAMSVSGQVNFTKGADKVSPNFEFHSMWIAAPRPGSAKPRIRFDGLTLGLKTGAVDVEGTAIAVDGAMPDLYRPDVLPQGVTAEGFLASGRLDIDGWASMSAAMGFLELRKKGVVSRPKHSFFLYGQMEKLSEPIDTPVGRIYLREFGFGFGYRYTLAGIAQAEKARSPQELVKILDDVSKYQGSLNTFQAWEPTYDNDDITLALRGMFALSAASERGSDYKAKEEAELPNPLLFDIIVGFRTDLTFLISLRAFVSVNYHDWISASTSAAWKSNPTMRGYLYFSVPRKEFLGRFIADGKGHVGIHPKLPAPVATAIRNSRFSATLYIRPGLFHAELGWPYELGFTFGRPDDKFFMEVQGGLIHRIEDLSVLNGIAFKAKGALHLEGRVGGSSLGAAAVAHANFAIEARILSYLSLKDIGDSFFYGYMRIDVAIGVRVEVWLSFKIFRKRITLSASFSLHLALSIAIEAVIGPHLIGGRANVSIGVRAFGRSLSVSIGFSFNNGNLAIARAKVARFMELGLSAPIPDKAQDGERIERNPKPQPPRSESAGQGDQTLDEVAGGEPLPDVPPEEEEDEVFRGRPITASDFWAFLYPTRTPIDKSDAKASAGKQWGDKRWYVMQLVPRDHTPLDGRDDEWERDRNVKSTFYASPKAPLDSASFPAPGHRLLFQKLPHTAGAYMARIDHHGSEVEVDLSATNSDPFALNLSAVVDNEDGQDLRLGRLLQQLFLGEAKEEGDDHYGGTLEELGPRKVDINLGRLAEDAKTSAEQLARAGRSRANLTGKEKREAEIEEARSAVLAAVVETAGQIALAGADPNQPWPPRLSEIDARDFGLTFLINDAAIETLFEEDERVAPPKARFTVLKSDANPIGGDSTGTVRLFNHPNRMFRKAQPKFTPSHVIDPQGIILDWDLEPAWGNSVGAYDDPEFHLKQYRIRRTIRGVPGNEYRADFVVKAVAPVQRNEDQLTFLRPDFQFIDDLRKQDPLAGGATEIPDILRRLVLGELTSDDKKKDDEGEKILKNVDVASIDVLYEIVPVDIAGTSDFGQSYVVSGLSLIDLPPVSPREITLQVAYDGMPTHMPYTADTLSAGDSGLPDVAEPQVKILMKTPAKRKSKEPEWPTNSLYLLRVWPQPIAPSGSYGADAVDQAKRRPDRAAIDKSRPGTIDFVLSAAELPQRDWPKATLIAEFLEEENEEPTLRYYKFSIHRVPKVGEKLGAAFPMAELRKAIGAQNAPNATRQGCRIFLTTIDGKPSNVNAERRGEWQTVAFNIAIDKRLKDPSSASSTMIATAISSVVEVLEQPVHYEFRPIERRDMRAESGRVIVLQPSEKGDLAQVEDGAAGFEGQRDVARRTATRLEWNANPKSLKLTTGGDVDNNAIAGFDLHFLDPDALPGRAANASEIVENARPLGRVSLLASELRGLDPSGFGDFGRIESAYPSATLRQKMAPAGTRKAGWYSSAETTAIFPEPAIRRSIMPDPDEGLIAALFAGGKPESIRVSIPAWSNGNWPLAGWEITDVGGNGWGEFTASTETGRDTRQGSVTFAVEGGFTVPTLRQLLQNLRLSPRASEEEAASKSETAALGERLRDPDYLSAVNVQFEAIRTRPAQQKINGMRQPIEVVVATQLHGFDLMPILHPILGDTLAFLQYDAQSGDLARANGRIYRRYALAPDTNPEISAKDFEAYLDETPPERDPYGWGALRTLGLATGFRLFDTETGDYARFDAGNSGLGKRIEAAFSRALARYPGRDNGQPFTDILTQPWGNIRLAWFDGGNRAPDAVAEKERVRNEMLAVVQIALRPHPDRQVAYRPSDLPADLPVRYFALVADATAEIGEDVWTIAATDFKRARYDVLTVGRSLVSQKPVRLTEEEPQTDVYENRPAVTLIDGTVRVIAIVREIRLVPELWGRPLLRVNKQSHDWRRVDQPAVLDELHGADLNPELAFGKFESLSGADWADALFRPVPGGKAAVTHLAMDRLGQYAARRFAPIAIPLATDDTKPEELDQLSDERGQLAYRIVRFWSRFTDHCAPAWGWRVEGPRLPRPIDAISFSLGTVADPGQWRCAPSPSGRVSVTIVDAERRGARRKYAVRPYGRYEAWSQAAPDKIALKNGVYGRFLKSLPQGLEECLPDKIDAIGRQYFIDTTLPRTEPLEKPVILSSVTRPGESGKPGRMELVVAHGSDMVLAQANRRNAALLAPLDISVGYWREFAHLPWSNFLSARYNLNVQPMQAFGSLDARLDQSKLTISRDEAAARLVNFRQRVPDAWLGSTLISATNLPYFFRVHALVHSTAGVVVSEQVATTFEEGFYRPAWPTTTWPEEEEQEQPSWVGRQLAGPHRYSVERRWVDDEGERTIVTFEISAVRFIDCMYPDDARLWFGKDGTLWLEEFRLAAHLPDPGVSYRIALEARYSINGTGDAEVLARAPELEVLPMPPSASENQPEAPLYLFQQSGNRLTPKVSVDQEGSPLNTQLFGGVPRPEIHGLVWKIDVPAQLAEEPAPLVRLIENKDFLNIIDAVLGQQDIPGNPDHDLPPAIAALLETRIEWQAALDPALLATAIDVLNDANAPEAAEALKSLVGSTLATGSLTVLLTPVAARNADVTAALTVLMAGVPPVYGPVMHVVLRRPLSNEERKLFKPGRSKTSKLLAEWIGRLADEHIFGADRHPTLFAFKGTLPPIRATIGPKEGV